MQESDKSQNSYIIPVAVLVLLIAIAAGGYLLTNSNKVSESPLSIQTPSSPIASSQATANKYKDGTYEAIGNYNSPGGSEELDVTITLKDGVVTDSNVTPKATRPNSVKFQGMFVANYKPLVVGKSIDQISLTKVSGSSLAPKGFNDALQEIKAQAKI